MFKIMQKASIIAGVCFVGNFVQYPVTHKISGGISLLLGMALLGCLTLMEFNRPLDSEA